MRNIIVTGATGFLGKALMQKLQKSFKVYAISRTKQVDDQNTKWIKLDFSKEWKPVLLPKQVDIVIHLSQSEKFRDFPNSALEIFQVNSVSTLKLLEYSVQAKVKKFIYISSGGVGGLGKDVRDINFYITSKLVSELLVENFKPFFQTIILRPFFIYGPGLRKTLLISRLISSIKENKTIFLEGKNGIRINPIYIEDAVDAIIQSLKLKISQTLDLCGQETLTIRKISKIIGDELEKEPKFKVIQSKGVDLVGDYSQTKRLSKAKFKFTHGIEELIKNYE